MTDNLDEHLKSWQDFCRALVKVLYPEKKIEDLISDLCKALRNHNCDKVKDDYELIAKATIYNKIADSNKNVDSNKIKSPMVGSLHYGCGLLGAWFPIELRPHSEYFRFYTDANNGWSCQTKSGRKSFESYYQNQLSLTAHLASYPFIQKDITFFLSLKDKSLKDKSLKVNDDILCLPNKFCQKLHEWLISSDDVAHFLDGDLAHSPELDVLTIDKKKKIVAYLQQRTEYLFPKGSADDNTKFNIALRALTGCLYSALHLEIFEVKSECKLNSTKLTGILVRIKPLYTRPMSPGSDVGTNHNPGYEYCDFANFISAYAIHKAQSIDEASVRARTIEPCMEKLVFFFSRIEQLALAHFQEMSALTTESIIRECSNIDERILEHMNRWRDFLVAKLDSAPDVKIKEKITNNDGMVGASQIMMDLMDQLAQRVKENTKFQTLFFYSEPGCGKENLTQLCHLFSLRGKRKVKEESLAESIQHIFPDYFENTNFDNGKIRNIKNELNNSTPLMRSETNQGNSIQWELELPSGDKIKIIHDGRCFFPVNCGLSSDEEIFDRYVFGELRDKKTKVGAVLAAYLTNGTVFFDEFNTLKKEFESKFLRFLENPYKFIIRGIDREFEANILAIFASNKNREELVKEVKFNNAVVFRATKNFYTIPPLRDRKEDIAVYVLHHLLKQKIGNYGSGVPDPIKCIRKINVEAMRLICEMEWKENYRGLTGFLDTLINERKLREFKAEEISFKEVLHALKIMDALKA